MAWTPQQQEAIDTRGKGLIVSAAAGSGKTSVLVERLLQIMIEETPEKKVPADRMIVVTFTNDAAAEMKARLNQALDQQLQMQPKNRWIYEQQIRLQNAHISTISAFCFDLIRDHMTNTGFTSGFRILNDTEINLLETKAADTVLNQWHQKHAKEMKLLWDCFCEKNDKPLETILLNLHQFLSSVPFRQQWEERAIAQLELPLEQSAYHKYLFQNILTQAKQAVQYAEEAAALSDTLYDTEKENNVAPWIYQDYQCLSHLLKQLQSHNIASEEMCLPLLKKKQERASKRFPSKKKTMVHPESFERIKVLRKQYSELESNLIKVLQTVVPFEQIDLEMHRKLLPILLELESDLCNTIWAEKLRQNALSFEDGERLTLELLAEENSDGSIGQSALAKELSEYYALIMIDEHQDSNNKQNHIFQLLSHNCIDPITGKLRYGDNIFLVGDVKQAIYRFRLTNPKNFVQAIQSSYSDTSVCRHITLNCNFRSVPAILHFVNFICGNLMSEDCGEINYTAEEALVPGSVITELLPEAEQKVEIAVLSETKEDMPVQIQYIIRHIQNMIQQETAVAKKDGQTRPCCYSDFCILLRSNDACRKYAHALENAGIPVILPEEKGYLQAREISILLDMLRVLDNPLLDTALAAVMLSPMFWFTAQELLQIRKFAKKKSLYVGLCQAIGVIEEEKVQDTDSITDENLLQKCQNLYQTIQNLRQNATMLPLEALIRRIYDKTDFLSVMQLTKGGDKKRANLSLLLQYAKQYEDTTDAAHSGLPGFLRYVDWLLESGNDFQQSSLSVGMENAVSVKTMHKSKGLEFPFVFLSDLEKSFSAQDKQKSAVFSDNGMVGFRIKNPENYTSAKTLPFTIVNTQADYMAKSEELRLLYVAMTRAKQQLFLPLLLDKARNTKSDLLTEYAMQITDDGVLPPALVQSAGCMAHWIWMCLVLRHDYTLDKGISLPWQRWSTPKWSESLSIHYTFQLPESITSTEVETTISAAPSEKTVAEIRHLTQFSYQSKDCTRKSLLSVSAVQEEYHKKPLLWKRPRFQQKTTKLTGAERGTAIHTFFQYANWKQAEENPVAEIQRLQQFGFLTAEQANVITAEIVKPFFSDQIYRRMIRAKQVLREQKFLVQCRDLGDAPEITEILQIYTNSDSMLKGIIDLAFLEDDAFILVDYKTDFVSHARELIDNYQQQLLLYREALRSITGKPVRECWIYSTHLKRSIPVFCQNNSNKEQL